MVHSFKQAVFRTLTLKGLRCVFVTLRTKGGSFWPPPPASSKTKEARTMKLCTVIAYYITSINKQLKSLNSHRSIVCGYCSFVCLITKSELKSDQIFKFFKLKRNSHSSYPFQRWSKKYTKNIIFSREALISGEGWPEILTLPANSKTKEARTIKLCTFIAYYITSITKQLKFLNSYCSIVCSYCSVVCLIAKKWSIFNFVQIKRNSPSW